MGYILGIVVAVAIYAVLFKEDFDGEQLEKVGVAVAIIMVVFIILAVLMNS